MWAGFTRFFCWRPGRFVTASNHRTTETSDHRNPKGGCKTSRTETDRTDEDIVRYPITERRDSHELRWTRSDRKRSPSLRKSDCFGRDSDKLMKGFPGEAGPPTGADRTIAGT